MVYHFPALKLSQIRKIAFQLALAIVYLHKRHVIHRDLKLENVLFTLDGNVKLIDFGWAVHSVKNDKRKTFAGTFSYMAPEILEDNFYSKSVDVWSFGLILFEMAFKKLPFPGSDFKQLKKSTLDLPLNIPDDGVLDLCAIDLLRLCLEKNDEDRISIEEVIAHSFFKEERV